MRVRGLNLRCLALWILFLCFFQSPVARAENLLVPEEFPTIQEALDASTTGTVIVVSPGTYVESLQFPGHDLVLRSTDPTSSSIVRSTVLQVDQTLDGLSAIVLSGTETSSTLIMGLMLFAPDHFSTCNLERAGIEANHSRATIQYCIIEGFCGGGGIRNPAGFILDSEFNRGRAMYGAGINGATGFIARCRFYRNSALNLFGKPVSFVWGGGIANSSADIADCYFERNVASDVDLDDDRVTYGFGGVLGNCSGNVSGCTFVESRATFGNIGYHHLGDFTENVVLNSVSSNSTWEFYGIGGDCVNNRFIGCENSGIGFTLEFVTGRTVTIAGNLWLNCPSPLFREVHGNVVNNVMWNCPDAVIQDNCDPWVYSIIPSSFPAATGSFTADPRLVFEDGFPIGLHSSSPALDTGGFVSILTSDTLGLARPFRAIKWEERGDGSGFDIGPFEYQSEVPPPTAWLLRGAATPRAGTSEGPQTSAPAVEQLMKRLASPYDQREFVEVPVLIPAPSK